MYNIMINVMIFSHTMVLWIKQYIVLFLLKTAKGGHHASGHYVLTVVSWRYYYSKI